MNINKVNFIDKSKITGLIDIAGELLTAPWSVGSTLFENSQATWFTVTYLGATS